jgi:hypothetical protein
MAIGHVRIKFLGTYSGVDVVNTHWYRCTDLLSPDASTIGDIFSALDATVFDAWMAAMVSGYTLDEIETQIWSSAWAEVYPVPPRSAVGRSGSVSGSVAGPANSAVLKASFLAGTQLQPKDTKLIKRSHLAFGPIPETALGDGGAFLTSAYSSGVITDLTDALAATLNDITQLGDLQVERVSSPDSAGVRNSILLAAWQFRQLASFRRSRQL